MNMAQEIDYFEKAKPFPGDNLFSIYNLKILAHFLNYTPILLLGGKYAFFQKLVHRTLFDLSQITEQEITECFKKTLSENKLCNPNSLKFLEYAFLYPVVLYMAIRVTKPHIVVETGVNSGRSTSFILQALHDNKKGKLYSIDLGHNISYDSESGIQRHILPGRLETGWLIPEHLKKNWVLILGDSKKELPKLFNKLGSIDFFSHDGEHTDSNMMFEYILAMKFLKAGGILMSDDVLFSQNGPNHGYLHNTPHYNAWISFSNGKENSHMINFQVGILTKEN